MLTFSKKNIMSCENNDMTNKGNIKVLILQVC